MTLNTVSFKLPRWVTTREDISGLTSRGKVYAKIRTCYGKTKALLNSPATRPGIGKIMNQKSIKSKEIFRGVTISITSKVLVG
jgi:hypothetical protein